jgi:hypothetical protein
MTRIVLFTGCLIFFSGISARSQDTLPEFSVVAKPNNRNVISWTNTFKSTTQISIQRSSDSTRFFQTILTVPDPSALQNGFVDSKATSAKVFYRLFIVLDWGKYQFSRSRRPSPDDGRVAFDPVPKDNQRLVLANDLSSREVNTIREKMKQTDVTAPQTEKYMVIKKNNRFTSLPEKNFKRFKDSIVFNTRDTIVFESVDTLVIKPYVAQEIFRASRYVYTEKYGNVMIALPDAATKKYSIAFFEDNKTPLFEIKELRATSLIVDKSNFIHSGWFWFELYESGELKERHRIFIPRDF